MSKKTNVVEKPPDWQILKHFLILVRNVSDKFLLNRKHCQSIKKILGHYIS